MSFGLRVTKKNLFLIWFLLAMGSCTSVATAFTLKNPGSEIIRKGTQLGENQLMLIWRPFFNSSGTQYKSGAGTSFGHLMMWTGSSLPVDSVRGLAERKSQFLSFTTKQQNPWWKFGFVSSVATGHYETCNAEANLLKFCQENGDTASYRIFEVSDCGCTPGKKIVDGMTAEIKKINYAFALNHLHQYVHHHQEASEIRAKYRYSVVGDLETESKNCASIILSLIAEHGGPHGCHQSARRMTPSDKMLLSSIVSCAVGGSLLLGTGGVVLFFPLVGLSVVMTTLVVGAVSSVGGVGIDLARRGFKFEHWARSVKPKCVLNRDLHGLVDWVPNAELLGCFLDDKCFRQIASSETEQSYQASSESSQL